MLLGVRAYNSYVTPKNEVKMVKNDEFWAWVVLYELLRPSFCENMGVERKKAPIRPNEK